MASRDFGDDLSGSVGFGKKGGYGENGGSGSVGSSGGYSGTGSYGSSGGAGSYGGSGSYGSSGSVGGSGSYGGGSGNPVGGYGGGTGTPVGGYGGYGGAGGPIGYGAAPVNIYYSGDADFGPNGERLPEKYRPITAWGYLGYMLVFAIPLVGFIVELVLAFSSGGSIARRNFARAFLLIYLIGFLIGFVVVLSMGISLNGLLGRYYY